MQDNASNQIYKILLKKVREDIKLPSLGISISKVVEIASSDENSVSELAHFILSDVALTQQILRVSNTVTYRTSLTTQVTTISRAIFLLGFETVKTIAITTLLVDGFKDKKQARSVHKELVQALCSSIISREIASKSHYTNKEEIAVASLFKNIGRILVASFDHELYDQINVISQNDKLDSNDICTNILGCSYQKFGETVLQEWHIPDSIISATQYLTKSEIVKTQNIFEWAKQVTNFSSILSHQIIYSDKNNGSKNISNKDEIILNKLEKTLGIETEFLNTIVNKAKSEIKLISTCLEINMSYELDSIQHEEIKQKEFCDEFMLPGFDSSRLIATSRFASGKPTNARDLLLTGVQDATQMLASSNVSLNDLVLLVLETLYTAMGFHFATACLRDIKSSLFMSKLAVGENFQIRQKSFRLSLVDDNSIFHLAMKNDVDLMIANTSNEKIQTMLPSWHKSLLPDAKSFIILPLIIDQKSLGFFYADRNISAEEGVSPDETVLIKTLKSQVLAAMLKR
jgi:HD-like signal output (HDOD) protein